MMEEGTSPYVLFIDNNGVYIMRNYSIVQFMLVLMILAGCSDDGGGG